MSTTNTIGDYPMWMIPSLTSPFTGIVSSNSPPEMNYGSITVKNNDIIEILMVRLAEFYGLPKEAQGLIMALLKEPKDKELLAVFADWLEENNRKESTKVRGSI